MNDQLNWKDLNKKTPFQVPEGYFEEAKDLIFASTISKSTPKGRLKIWSKISIGIAASVLIAAGYWIGFYQNENKEFERKIAEIDTAEMIQYVHNEDFTEYELATNIALTDDEKQQIIDESYVKPISENQKLSIVQELY